jgi:hypothetical protein
VLEGTAVLSDEFRLERVAVELRYREDDVERKQLMKPFARDRQRRAGADCLGSRPA